MLKKQLEYYNFLQATVTVVPGIIQLKVAAPPTFDILESSNFAIVDLLRDNLFTIGLMFFV